MMNICRYDDFLYFLEGYRFSAKDNDSFIQIMDLFDRYILENYSEYLLFNECSSEQITKLLCSNQFDIFIQLLDQFLKKELMLDREGTGYQIPEFFRSKYYINSEKKIIKMNSTRIVSSSCRFRKINLLL